MGKKWLQGALFWSKRLCLTMARVCCHPLRRLHAGPDVPHRVGTAFKQVLADLHPATALSCILTVYL